WSLRRGQQDRTRQDQRAMSIHSTGLGEAERGAPGRVLAPKWDGRSTFTVEEAGVEILGLSRCPAYAAAQNGSLGTIGMGRCCIVRRHVLKRMLLSALVRIGQLDRRLMLDIPAIDGLI